MNYLEITTPNVRHMRIVLVRPLSENQEEEPIIVPTTLDSQHTPIPMIHDVTFRVLCGHDTSWKIICSCPDIDRVYLKDIIPRTSCYKIKGWKINLGGLYCTNIKYPSFYSE